MSLVLVQVGQCGNQVGKCLLEGVSDVLNGGGGAKKFVDWRELTAERFFRRERNDVWMARAVLVDTENKVIDRLLLPKKSTWHYSHKNSLKLSGGCGNLWSRGYCEYGPILSDQTIDIVQSELEKCDSVGGLIILMSAAGGTGSGVGAHLTQVFRDAFPRTFIVNQLVWPYSTGEVVIQSYNTLLTLSHISPFADALLNFYNDELHQICTRFNTSINIDNLNSVLGDQLAATFCPSFDSNNHVTRLGDLLENLTSHSGFKMLSVKSVPHTAPRARDFSTDTWIGLSKLLAREVGRKSVSLSDVAIVRGNDAKNADLSEFVRSRRYAAIVTGQVACQVWREDAAVSKDPLNITLVGNNAGIAGALERTIERAWRLMSNGAYLHHMAKHGIGQEQLADAITSVSRISANYSCLT
uniref:Tubulin delta chain n=1 Tax=Strigamia maritima TaxID=126957 RepID=T1J6C5_STRMM